MGRDPVALSDLGVLPKYYRMSKCLKAIQEQAGYADVLGPMQALLSHLACQLDTGL